MAEDFFMLTAKKEGGRDSHWDATPPAAMLESVCDGSPSNIRKGAWSEAEDALLRQCIEKYGEGNWHKVPLRAGLQRCRKSCRLRWLNYLSPNIKRGEFSSDEVELVIRMHKLLGNRWSLIAGRLPGRTANDIKNYWNTHLSKHFAIATKPTKSTLNLPITPFKPIASRPSLLERELLLKMSAVSIPPAPMPSTVVTNIMSLQPSKLGEHSKQEADDDYSQWLSQLCNALDEDILLKENRSINSELDFNNIDQIDYWDDSELWSRLASLGKEGQ